MIMLEIRQKSRPDLCTVKDQLKAVCKIGQGEDCCRYLLVGGNGFECGKVDQQTKSTIDLRVEIGGMLSKGDNCEGIENLNTKI